MPKSRASVAQAFENDDELVAAEAGDCIRLAERAAQTLRDLRQEQVAGRVSARVVERIEVVEVEKKNGPAHAAAAGRRQCLTEPVL